MLTVDDVNNVSVTLAVLVEVNNNSAGVINKPGRIILVNIPWFFYCFFVPKAIVLIRRCYIFKRINSVPNNVSTSQYLKRK